MFRHEVGQLKALDHACSVGSTSGSERIHRCATDPRVKSIDSRRLRHLSLNVRVDGGRKNAANCGEKTTQSHINIVRKLCR